MPLVDVIEELFVVAAPERVRCVVCDETGWRACFPGVALTPYDDRGRLGIRWAVSGELEGTAEVWLEEHGDGTIVHAYLRADPARGDPRRLGRSRRRTVQRYALPLKQYLLDVKDLLEGDRPLGTALVPLHERVSSASQEKQGTRRHRQRPTGTSSEGASPDGRPDDLEHRDRG